MGLGRPPSPGAGVYLATMISLASAAFGVIAALAWNEAITALFRLWFPQGGDVIGLFVYAIVVTIIAVVVMVNLARAAERLGGSAI